MYRNLVLSIGILVIDKGTLPERTARKARACTLYSKEMVDRLPYDDIESIVSPFAGLFTDGTLIGGPIIISKRRDHGS